MTKESQPTKPKKPAKSPATRGLGRGLSSLLGDAGVAAAAGISTPQPEPGTTAPANVNGLRDIPVEWINTGPWQPRRVFDKDALADLANSIRQKGIVQPVLVRPNPNRETRFELIAGERRWRAAQLAKIHTIPAVVRDFSDNEAYEIALIENIQRADLTVIEEAHGYQKLLDHHQYTQEQLAEIIGKSRSHVANLLRLLSLPEDVQNLIVTGQLTMGQVRPIINHPDCSLLAREIVKKGLSARQVEALAKKPRRGSTPAKAANHGASADIRALEAKAAATLGLTVKIGWNDAREKGEVKLQCQSLEQLEDVLAKLGIK
jgi:ParB family chromosome partitioning protein